MRRGGFLSLLGLLVVLVTSVGSTQGAYACVSGGAQYWSSALTNEGVRAHADFQSASVDSGDVIVHPITIWSSGFRMVTWGTY